MAVRLTGDQVSFDVCTREGPYRRGCYRFTLYVPPSYPFSPPRLFALSSVWHPNINTVTGEVNLPLEWSPVLTLGAAIMSVQLLLLEPSPMNICNPEAHLLFTADPVAYEHYVQGTFLDDCLMEDGRVSVELGEGEDAQDSDHGVAHCCGACSHTSCLGVLHTARAVNMRADLDLGRHGHGHGHSPGRWQGRDEGTGLDGVAPVRVVHINTSADYGAHARLSAHLSARSGQVPLGENVFLPLTSSAASPSSLSSSSSNKRSRGVFMASSYDDSASIPDEIVTPWGESPWDRPPLSLGSDDGNGNGNGDGDSGGGDHGVMAVEPPQRLRYDDMHVHKRLRHILEAAHSGRASVYGIHDTQHHRHDRHKHGQNDDSEHVRDDGDGVGVGDGGGGGGACPPMRERDHDHDRDPGPVPGRNTSPPLSGLDSDDWLG